MSDNILKIRDLSVNYQTDRGKLKALRNVDLDISNLVIDELNKKKLNLKIIENK